MLIKLLTAALISLFALSLAYLHLIRKRRIHRLVPSYIRWLRESKRLLNVGSPGIKHIMFFVVDHFEPGSKKEIVREWVKRYPLVADRHKDSEGTPPKHTFFYPAEREERIEHLEILAELASCGYGEVELHLHHRDDTADTLREKIRDGIRAFNMTGALRTSDGRVAFGFIHGDWALDNSIMEKGRNLCGVNNEISILRDEGCYADFTFPALYTDAQPEKINSLYYATDDPDLPKSHNNGPDVSVNDQYNAGNLMIIQGPTTINFLNWKTYCLLRAVSCGIEGRVSDPENAVDEWVRARVHVKGKPDWIFVKVHTHGAIPANMDFFLGSGVERIYSHLESKYNDRKDYCLHYVSAREAYNIIKAAEAGKTGSPEQYRDFLIKPYLNTIRNERSILRQP